MPESTTGTVHKGSARFIGDVPGCFIFLDRTGACDRIAPDPSFREFGQVGAHSWHGAGAQRLHPREFQRIEYGASFGVGRRLLPMKLCVMIAQPKRYRVGSASRLRHQFRRKARPG